MRKFLLVSLIALTFLVGISAYLVFAEKETRFSSDQVKITIEGPKSLTWGQITEYRVGVENNNKIALKDVSVELKLTDGLKADKKQVDIGALKSHRKKIKTIDIIPHGPKGKSQKIKAQASYSVQNTNSILDQKTSQKVTIDEIPLIINVEKNNLISPSAKINYPINFENRTDKTLTDIEISLPSLRGLEQTSFSPQPDIYPRSWRLKNMKPGEKKEIIVSGTVTSAEKLTFRVTFNAKTENTQMPLSQEYKFTQVTAQNPLALTQNINGEGDTFIAQNGDKINLSIDALNTTNTTIKDLEIETTISQDNEIIDLDSLSAPKGTVEPQKYKITWGVKDIPSLTALGPDSKVTLEANFKLKEKIPINNTNKNLSIDINTSLSTENPPENLGYQELISKAESQLKLKGGAELLSNLSSLSGANPPEPSETTEYKIEWKLLSGYNDIKDLTVSSYLPENIKWQKGGPAYENVSFDQEKRIVTWKVDNLLHGTGHILPVRQASFEVEIKPDKEKNQYFITGEVKAEGKDAFTNRKIKVYKNSLKTPSN